MTFAVALCLLLVVSAARRVPSVNKPESIAVERVLRAAPSRPPTPSQATSAERPSLLQNLGEIWPLDALGEWTGVTKTTDSPKDVAMLTAEVQRLKSDVEKLQEWKGLQETREAHISKPSGLYIGLTGKCPSDKVVGHFENNITISDCKRKCDALNECKGFLYWSNPHSSCILRSETCNQPPGPCDFTKRACYWNLKTVLPTHCPADMPEHDPYWAQFLDTSGHKDVSRCDHKTCKAQFNNRKRLATLRELLKATDILLKTQKVDYTLVSGTLLGQERCGDIIPWDGDADIQVLDTDRGKLDALFEGPPNEDEHAGDRGVGDRRVALDFIGYPKFALFSNWRCIPWALVDTETGYYVDFFSPAQVKQGNTTVARRSIYTGKVPCKAKELYASWPDAYWQQCTDWQMCDEAPAEVIWPSKRCKFADFEVNCPADTAAYLSHMYPEALVPDKVTRNDP